MGYGSFQRRIRDSDPKRGAFEASNGPSDSAYTDPGKWDVVLGVLSATPWHRKYDNDRPIRDGYDAAAQVRLFRGTAVLSCRSG